MASPLASIPNFGPKSVAMLNSAGITNLEQLRALEGALTGEPWQRVAKADRTSLLLARE